MISPTRCSAMIWVYLHLIVNSLFAVTASDVYAQPAHERVIVGWIDVPPYYQQRASGQVTGFAAEIMLKIAHLAKFDIEFRQYNTVEHLFAALRTGEIHVLAAARASSLPGLDLAFSAPIGQSEMVVVVDRADVAALSDLDRIVGKQVGFFSHVEASEAMKLLDRNNPIQLPLSADAIVKLLAGDIQALIADETWITGQLRAAMLDHRVRRIATPIERNDRVVALHPSKAHLLGAINKAIADLAANGEINELQTMWAIKLPVPAPETLTVGVFHFQPYQVVNEDGTFSGFAVDVLRDLATRANLNLSFKSISLDELHAGPGPDRYDLLPQAAKNDGRALRMDFTRPIDESNLSIFVRAGIDREINNLDDVIGLRVAVHATNPARSLVEQHDELALEILDKSEDLLPALLEQRADVVLYPTELMRDLIANAGLTQEIEEIKPPFYKIERAPALRFGLGDVREQLNSVISGYLVSDRYRQLQQNWFGEKVFWTSKRVMYVIGFGGLTAMILSSALFRQRWILRTREIQYQREEQQRLKLYEQEQAHTQELQAVVSELERSNKELDDFAHIASHDLKEPLRGIAINADLLKREEVSAAGIQRIERMVFLTTRMEQLLSDLLLFSRLGRGDLSKQDIDLSDVIQLVKYELREMLVHTRGTVSIETDFPLVHADRSKIEIIFRNLIINSLKYNNAEDKSVSIGYRKSVTVDGKQWKNVFYVKDNGIGIDKKNHDKIFRIFTRLNKAKDYGQGTGAGLSFVSKIIEEYGHQIAIDSQLGRGSTFYFPLPIAENSQSDGYKKDSLLAL